MSCINSINTVNASDESYAITQQEIKNRAPKDISGELIYPAEKVSSFLLGTTLETQQDIKKVLFNDSAKRSYVYENSFNNALIKLLSEEEIDALHEELKQSKDRFRTYENKSKPISKATKLELSEFISAQFIDYIAQDQALEGMTPTQEKVFEFLYKFYDSLEDNTAMFNATTSGSITTALSLKFDRRQTEINGQMAQAGISDQVLQYTNEGVAAIFMDTIYRDADRQNVSMDQILSADNSDYYLGIYGSPDNFDVTSLTDPKNVFDDIISYYISHYKDISAEHSKAIGPKKDMLRKELKAIESLIGLTKEGIIINQGLLAQNWDSIVDSNLIYLKKFDVNISLKRVGLEDASLDDITEEINSRDSIGILADNQVNPVTRMNKELKLLLRTLPEVDSRAPGEGFTFATNKLGLPKLSDFGQTIAVLYRITSNKPTLDSKLAAIVEHINREEDFKFQVLLDRLSVSNGTIGQHTAFSGELLLEFNTAMNNAENSYTMMQISDAGARNLINANGESDVRVVKDRWAQNFKKNVRYNYGKLQDGTFVLDLKKPYTTELGTKEELGKLFKNGPRNLSQAFEYLGLLGIKFSNQAYVMEQQLDKDNGDSFIDLTHSLLKYLAESESNISELYKEDQKGRLKELITLQLDSSKALGSLQFNGPSGKIYSISQKGFINVIADKLNEDAELYNQLKQSPTLIGSHWAELMYSEADVKMEIGVLMGAVNTDNGDSKDYSRMMRGDITAAQVSSILDGFVPLIRTGNKKLEKTIRVGKPDYTVSRTDMAQRLAGYLKSEIITANAIRNGAASNIKGIDREGASLQMFNDPKFASIKPTAEALVANSSLTEQEVDEFVNNPSTISSLREYVDNEIEEVKEVLNKFNIITDKLENIGIDNNQLSALGKTIDETAGSKISEKMFDKIAEQIFIIRQTSLHEQFKFLLGHPAVYGDIFKRTSGLVGPKKYPPVDEEILQWVRENYSNKGNPNRDIDGKVRMVTMKEVTETSVYLNEYKDILNTEVFERTDLNDSIDDAYTNMEIFDGGGLVHIDFYRLVRRLTSSWTEKDENVYNKLIAGQPITREEVALFDPIKPQVLAQALEDKIDLRLFNKFALFPIHPGLSKTITDINEGNSNVLDDMYQDMNKHNLDYIVMESAVKVGAKKEKSTNQFSNLIDQEGGYQMLNDLSSIQEYSLEYFGMQMDPKAKFGNDVTVGVQLLSMLPTNVYNNGEVADEYKGTNFSEDETWEDAITRYHDINTELIGREASALASSLGFSYTPDGKFQFLGSLNKMRDTIIEEMTRRDIPENVQESLADLFTREVTFAGQLFEKNKIETLFNAIVTNTVVRRKTNGNMVVLQSNFGYETTNKAQKQSQDVTGNRKLKSYSKDIAPSRLKGKSRAEIAEMKAKAPTTAMEVYLPHYYKEFLGQDLPPGTQVSIKALQAVGFRIPTEGINSLEYIIVKDFLPQHAGNSIIVPSEIVAKSGADFDIDKLTLFFPNTEYNSNTKSIDVIPMIAASEAGATKLRLQDLNAYKAVWGKLLANQPSELAKTIKKIDELYAKRSTTQNPETIAKIEKELENLDKQIIKDGFIELGQRNKLFIQPKQVLQNEMLFFIQDVLKHPASFPQLITPVGAYGLSKKAKEIDAIINPDKYEEDTIVEKPKTLHQKLSFGNIIETTYTMYQTLGGTGIVATGITHAAKAQRSGLRWNSTKKRPIVFNFENHNRELSLSDTKSYNTDRYINNEMQQYITGYVDGEKDPFVMYVNAGQEGAAVHMLLLRTGVPLDDVLYFMSQPIITDYLQLKGTHQTMAMRAKGKFLTNEAIKNKLKAKYPGETSSVEFDTELLEEMLPLNSGNMSSAHHSYQRQILEDYLRYKTYADQLRNLQTVNSYDKTKLKNGVEVIDLQALAETVKEDGYFKDAVVGVDKNENLIWDFEDRLVSESMLDPIEKVFRGTETLFKNVDLKNSRPEIKRFFIDKAKELIRDGVNQEDRVYILNKFDNFMLADIVHGARINGVEIRSMARELFRGNNSLPKIILELQESGEVNNLVLDNLLPMLDPHDEASFKSTTDNLKLVSKKYDSYDLDQLTFAMQELKETNPDVFNKLLVFSILQSGFDFNPNSFKQIIPGKDILDVTEEAFSMVNRMPNYAVDLPTLYQKFINNNWDNSRIVKQIYLTGSKAAMLEKDYHPGTTFKGAKYVTLHTRIGDKNSDTYQSNFYKLDLKYTNGEIDLNKSGYRKATKMGRRNKIIETGYTSLMPSNINPIPYELATVFSKEEAERIVARKKTLHISLAESELKSSRYILSDGTRIKIVPLQLSSKINKIMANDTVRTMADIKSKTSLAKKAGFNDFAHMEEQLEGFAKNKNSATLYKIEIEETGSAVFNDESDVLIDATKEELLEPSTLKDINEESQEC